MFVFLAKREWCRSDRKCTRPPRSPVSPGFSLKGLFSLSVPTCRGDGQPVYAWHGVEGTTQAVLLIENQAGWGGLGFVASVLKERRILGHYWGKPALLSEMLGEPLGLSADSDGRVAEKHRSSCGFGVMQPGQGAEGRAVWRTGDAYNRRQNALL